MRSVKGFPVSGGPKIWGLPLTWAVALTAQVSNTMLPVRTRGLYGVGAECGACGVLSSVRTYGLCCDVGGVECC